MAEETQPTELQRGLSRRHVQMIAIGGTIGTGLFLGAGTTIHLTGPSILLVYLVTGIFLFMMMRAIGELLYADPDKNSFVRFVSKYIGPGAGHFIGWSYWVTLILPAMAELTAIGHYVQFWLPTVPAWLIELIVIAVLIVVNLVAVKFFGEAEFWFASIKIIAILGLIAAGLIMILMQYQTPDGGTVSFGNIFSHFQLFPNGKMNFLMAFPMVFFAFVGIEFVGMMSAETKNPREVMPKVINQVLLRILIFYIGALAIIMAIFNWRDLSPDQSPFVQVFKLVGLNWAAGLVNFVVLTAAASALNTLIYSAGRDVYALALESSGKWQDYFSTLSPKAVPHRAILFSGALIAITPIINALPIFESAFNFFASATSAITLVIYSLIMWAHRKYRASQDFLPDGFLMPGYRVMSPLTLIFFGFIFFTLFLDRTDMIAAIGGIGWTVVFGWLSHRFAQRQS
jgi:L-asparagine transporter-like permease